MEKCMNDRTLEILIHLLGYLKEHNFDFDGLGDFSDYLIGNGYTEYEVAEAVDVLLDKFAGLTAQSSEIAVRKETSVRVLNEYERLKIPSSIYGYLIKLQSLGLVTPMHIERIIDYCLFLDSFNITEEDINEVLASIIFEDSDRQGHAGGE